MSRCPAGSSKAPTPAVSVPASPQLGDLRMPKAVDDMVVNHTDGLHVRIDDRRAHEAKPAALEILAHCSRLGGLTWNLPHGPPTVLDRTSAAETPLVCVETVERPLYF